MAVTALPPVISETPPRTPKESTAALYETPYLSVRQGRPSQAPARPARPDRKACVARHTSTRSAAAGSGSRRKRIAKVKATDPAVEAAAGVRRQRALVGRVRTSGRRVRGFFLSYRRYLEGVQRHGDAFTYGTPIRRQLALLVRLQALATFERIRLIYGHDASPPYLLLECQNISHQSAVFPLPYAPHTPSPPSRDPNHCTGQTRRRIGTRRRGRKRWQHSAQQHKKKGSQTRRWPQEKA